MGNQQSRRRSRVKHPLIHSAYVPLPSSHQSQEGAPLLLQDEILDTSNFEKCIKEHGNAIEGTRRRASDLERTADELLRKVNKLESILSNNVKQHNTQFEILQKRNAFLENRIGELGSKINMLEVMALNGSCMKSHENAFSSIIRRSEDLERELNELKTKLKCMESSSMHEKLDEAHNGYIKLNDQKLDMLDLAGVFVVLIFLLTVVIGMHLLTGLE